VLFPAFNFCFYSFSFSAFQPRVTADRCLLQIKHTPTGGAVSLAPIRGWNGIMVELALCDLTDGGARYAQTLASSFVRSRLEFHPHHYHHYQLLMLLLFMLLDTTPSYSPSIIYRNRRLSHYRNYNKTCNNFKSCNTCTSLADQNCTCTILCRSLQPASNHNVPSNRWYRPTEWYQPLAD